MGNTEFQLSQIIRFINNSLENQSDESKITQIHNAFESIAKYRMSLYEGRYFKSYSQNVNHLFSIARLNQKSNSYYLVNKAKIDQFSKFRNVIIHESKLAIPSTNSYMEMKEIWRLLYEHLTEFFTEEFHVEFYPNLLYYDIGKITSLVQFINSLDFKTLAKNARKEKNNVKINNEEKSAIQPILKEPGVISSERELLINTLAIKIKEFEPTFKNTLMLKEHIENVQNQINIKKELSEKQKLQILPDYWSNYEKFELPIKEFNKLIIECKPNVDFFKSDWQSLDTDSLKTSLENVDMHKEKVQTMNKGLRILKTNILAYQAILTLIKNQLRLTLFFLGLTIGSIVTVTYVLYTNQNTFSSKVITGWSELSSSNLKERFFGKEFLNFIFKPYPYQVKIVIYVIYIMLILWILYLAFRKKNQKYSTLNFEKEDSNINLKTIKVNEANSAFYSLITIIGCLIIGITVFFFTKIPLFHLTMYILFISTNIESNRSFWTTLPTSQHVHYLKDLQKGLWQIYLIFICIALLCCYPALIGDLIY